MKRLPGARGVCYEPTRIGNTGKIMTKAADYYVLTLSCQNRPGIVAAVATTLFESGADIREAHQYDDEETGNFFARIGFSFVGDAGLDAFRSKFRATAARFDMDWNARNLADRQ